MTNNDSITAAARIEAARRDMDPGKHGENNRAWFAAGAEWARAHLAAQEPTDAEIEAAADVLAESEDTGSIETARAVLSAARKA